MFFIRTLLKWIKARKIFSFFCPFNQTSATQLQQLLSLSSYFISIRSNLEWAINLEIMWYSKTIPTLNKKNTTRFVILTHRWRLELFDGLNRNYNTKKQLQSAQHEHNSKLPAFRSQFIWPMSKEFIFANFKQSAESIFLHLLKNKSEYFKSKSTARRFGIFT